MARQIFLPLFFASSMVLAINHTSLTLENSGSWWIFNLKYSRSRKPYAGSVRYFAHICFWAITDDKRELAQPKQPTDLRAPEEQVGCEGGAFRFFTLYRLRKVCKYSCTAEYPILSWKYLSAIGSCAYMGNPYKKIPIKSCILQPGILTKCGCPRKLDNRNYRMPGIVCFGICNRKVMRYSNSKAFTPIFQ